MGKFIYNVEEKRKALEPFKGKKANLDNIIKIKKTITKKGKKIKHQKMAHDWIVLFDDEEGVYIYTDMQNKIKTIILGVDDNVWKRNK